MKVLVVGSGAREHALVWKLAAEGHDVVCAPGNGGTPSRLDVRVDDLEGLARCASGFDLTLVGPEAPLAAGLVDLFSQRGLRVFGPTRAAAQLEASKIFSKAFLQRHGLPTARAEVVESDEQARRAAQRCGLPVVLKADGLAAGKGVWTARDADELEAALLARQALGDAATWLLVEEHLQGVELSVLAFSDGQSVALMPPARDYKRVGDDDTGPNTGGMGGYTWPHYATPDLLEFVERRILRPTVAGMAAEGRPYQGVLYCGLMLTADGPRVLEFNCRLGDPEAQLILPLLDSSLLEVCQSVCEGRLVQPRWRRGVTCGVVLAAPGYPDHPHLGAPVVGLDRLPQDVLAFHAGTAMRAFGDQGTAALCPGPPAGAPQKSRSDLDFASAPEKSRPDLDAASAPEKSRSDRDAAAAPEKSRAAIERHLQRLQPDPSQPASGDEGAAALCPGPPAGDPARLVTSGGRVLTLVAAGNSLGEARQRVYAAAPLVQFEGVHYRSDIGGGVAVVVV